MEHVRKRMLVLRNIPNRHTERFLRAIVEKHIEDAVDLVLPVRGNGVNREYANVYFKDEKAKIRATPRLQRLVISGQHIFVHEYVPPLTVTNHYSDP